MMSGEWLISVDLFNKPDMHHRVTLVTDKTRLCDDPLMASTVAGATQPASLIHQEEENDPVRTCLSSPLLSAGTMG